MGAVIFTLAALLVIGGLAALVNAINLIPTDLGLAWLQIGFTLLSSGVIVLVIGLAAKMLGQQKAVQVSPRTEPSLPDWSALPPGDDGKHPAIAVPDAAKSSDLAKAGIIAGAGVAAGALIGSALSSGEKPADSPKDFADEFERDLFADLPATPLKEDAEIARSKEDDDLAAFETLDAAKNEAEHSEVAPESVAFPSEAEIGLSDNKADEDDKGEEAESAPAPAAAPFIPSSNSDDAGVLINLDEFELPPLPPILQPVLPDVSVPAVPEPLVIEPSPAIEEAPPAVPGLIADADLAALTSDEPVLAPLETLDIVGSYDSGGTRFTMYSDGTVTAVGPTMDRRFVSLDALRKFIDGGAE